MKKFMALTSFAIMAATLFTASGSLPAQANNNIYNKVIVSCIAPTGNPGLRQICVTGGWKHCVNTVCVDLDWL